MCVRRARRGPTMLVSPLTLADSGYYGASWPAAVLHARPYSIRIATAADVDALVHIEGLCWVPALQAARAQLAERVSRGFTYVAIVPAHGVVAVLYTQRITARDELLAPGASSATHETLHVATGPVVQLLAVSALPQFTHLQLGAALRDLALQVARHEGAAEVVAMTRCSHLGRREFAGASQAYAAYVAAAVDPGLAFHTGAGARVVAIATGYRPADTENLGNAVLVCYSLEPQPEPEPAVLAPPPPAAPAALSVQPAASATPAASAPKFEGALGAALQRVGASLSITIDLASCLDSSLMDLEFDSFALSELFTLLEREVAPQLAPLPSTLLFDHPTPRAVLAYLDARAASRSGGGSDGLPPTSPLAAAAAAADAVSAAGASCASLARSLVEAPLTAPIALVLTSSRLPGGCSRSDTLTSLLRSHGDAIHTGPPGWSGEACGGGAAFGGYLSAPQGAERFGTPFFGIAEAEAITMDPHQRLLLELGTEILVGAVLGDSSARANGRPKTLGELLRSPSHMASQARTAVCVGLSNQDWQLELASSSHGARGGAYYGTSVAPSIAANRLSYVLGLGGASLVVDTACSSAGTALHLAARLLREPRRAVDRVVVGALDLLLSPRALAVRKHAGMLSEEGRCKAFALRADGYVRSEGGGALLVELQSPEAELTSPEAELTSPEGGARRPMSSRRRLLPPLCLLRGTAVNSDGRTARLTAPSALAQQSLLTHALADGGVMAAEVALLEAHGTLMATDCHGLPLIATDGGRGRVARSTRYADGH